MSELPSDLFEMLLRRTKQVQTKMALLVIYQSRFFSFSLIAHRQILFLFLNLFYAPAEDGLMAF